MFCFVCLYFRFALFCFLSMYITYLKKSRNSFRPGIFFFKHEDTIPYYIGLHLLGKFRNVFSGIYFDKI